MDASRAGMPRKSHSHAEEAFLPASYALRLRLRSNGNDVAEGYIEERVLVVGFVP
jgi:hypothetical protein